MTATTVQHVSPAPADSVDEILEMEVQLGMVAPLTTRFNQAEKLTINQAAKTLRISMSSLVRTAVLEWVEAKVPEYNRMYYHNLVKLTKANSNKE